MFKGVDNRLSPPQINFKPTARGSVKRKHGKMFGGGAALSVKITSHFRFDADKIIKDLRPRAFDRVLSDAQEKARFMRCPEHGKVATITLEAREQDSAKLNIAGCCEAFRKQVLDAIRRK